MVLMDQKNNYEQWNLKCLLFIHIYVPPALLYVGNPSSKGLQYTITPLYIKSSAFQEFYIYLSFLFLLGLFLSLTFIALCTGTLLHWLLLIKYMCLGHYKLASSVHG